VKGKRDVLVISLSELIANIT